MRGQALKDFQWAMRFEDHARKIIVPRLAERIIRFARSSPLQDMKQATDLTAITEKGNIALRLRRESCRYRDFTVRAWRESGVETEIDKLLSGHCNWYLYGWVYGN